MMDIETLKVQLQETEANMAHRLKALTDALEEATQKCREYSDTLQHIAHYWNGDTNETAMADALHHIVDVANKSIEGNLDVVDHDR